MSARFLFVTWEGGGTLPPQLALCRRLLDRGHQVAVLAEPPSRAEVEATGCTWLPFEHAPVRATRDAEDDPFRDWERSPLAVIRTIIDDKACGPAAAYAADIERAAKEFQADGIAVDAYLLGAVIGAVATGLPTVALSADLGMRPIPGRPPYGPGLAPAAGPLGRLRDRLMAAVQTRMLARGLPPLNALCASAGLAPLSTPLEALARVDRHLLLTARAFDYPVQPPENVRYVGPQLDDPVWTGSWTPPWDDPRPLVLVSLGSTFQDQAPVYQRLIEALGELPVRGLVTLGGVFEPGEFTAPDNVAVVESAPHGAVLEHAALGISHCGHGSVMRALTAGVPLVCLPLGRDQDENAARIAAHGAGLRLGPRAGVRAIRDAVRRVLEQPRFRAAAQQLAAAIQGELLPDPAIQEFESLVGTGVETGSLAL